MKNFTTMILAAGFGSRMKDLTEKIPKPLLKIKNTTLLSNTINFFENIGCNRFILNTHYLYKELNNYINSMHSDKDIILIHEPEILDTGGGIKNALKFFNNKNFLVTNCDIFWRKNNILDIKDFLFDLQKVKNCQLLLARKNKTYGVNKNSGDFVLENNSLRRWKKNDQINFYSGLQVLNPSVFNNIYKSKFSINEIWDNLIKKKELSGVIMQSDLFHIGDINTYLDITKNLPLD